MNPSYPVGSKSEALVEGVGSGETGQVDQALRATYARRMLQPYREWMQVGWWVATSGVTILLYTSNMFLPGACLFLFLFLTTFLH